MSDSANPEPLVAVRDLSKSYDGTQALKGVSVDLYAGQVHSLVGENGAGKSTLIKILSGLVRADGGSVTIAGRELSQGGVTGAESAGIVAVHQESTAFLDLDVPDNIFVGREIKRAGVLIDKAGMRRRAKELLASLGEELPLSVPASQLSVAQRQMVAIARALSLQGKLLILDEPTASLSAREVDVLHATVRRLRDQGVGILFVSHRLDEVLELSDQVTVFRDGTLVQSELVANWTKDSLIQSMVGRRVEVQSKAESAMGELVLTVTSLTTAHVRDISFEIRAGEILGLGGLVGTGRSEVARAVFGLDPITAGTIDLNGERLSGGVEGAISAGIALVPEDRQHEGLVLDLPVQENLAMSLRPTLSKRGWIDHAEEKRFAEQEVARLSIKTASLSAPVKSLSGGNQQKVVLGKWMARHPKVLILDEPTRGVDVGSKGEIHNLVRSLAAEGAAVLLISSDLPELVELSDRILVMRDRAIVGELKGEQVTQERVLDLAFGGSRS